MCPVYQAYIKWHQIEIHEQKKKEIGGLWLKNMDWVEYLPETPH